MNFSEYLRNEWVPALGCTEPASIAYAGLMAGLGLKNAPKKIILKVDPKIYKNCYAVGIPHSGHKTGIKWAAAIGVFLKNGGSQLQCFNDIDEKVLKKAGDIIKSNAVRIEIDKKRADLYIDISVISGKETGRCVIKGTHSNVTLIERNGKTVFRNRSDPGNSGQLIARKWANSMSPEKIIMTARRITTEDRSMIRKGAEQNLRIAEHGLSLFPKTFFKMNEADSLTRISGLVCAGVYARMWGEDFPVMSIAGSGNKGIVLAVPLLMLEKQWLLPSDKIEEAMALAMLFTSKTTLELGTLSAVCGCSNAAGIGLACAIVYLQGGGPKEISLAINNMVGNITGMICDGAKIGCALKTMTAVDSAFRSASLAINGIGIPFQDGIVGRNGTDSLANMGRIANLGMERTDEEILEIMKKKL